MVGVDWLATGLSLLGWYLMADHRVRALFVLMAANIAWGFWASTLQHWSLLLLQVCFMVFNLRTLRAWRREVQAENSGDSSTSRKSATEQTD